MYKQLLSAFGFSISLMCLATLTFGCESDSPLDTAQEFLAENDVEETVYQPPTIENGILSFQNRENLDITIDQLNRLSFTEYEAWERDHGIKTLYGEFNRIIIAEDKSLFGNF